MGINRPEIVTRASKALAGMLLTVLLPPRAGLAPDPADAVATPQLRPKPAARRALPRVLAEV